MLKAMPDEPETTEHHVEEHAMPGHHPHPAKKRWTHRLGNTGLLLLAPVLAILLTMFVFQSYQVDGVSMQNTLQNGDRLIVWKGSRTWDRLLGKQYVPNRGDVVVVYQANLSACGQDGKAIVKRVIGLPGERVVYKNSHYSVYNAAHPHGFNPDTTLPYGKADTALLNDASASDIDVHLSKAQLFISGDHRSDSCDSRYFGPIESSQIIGKVVLRVFPFNDAERF